MPRPTRALVPACCLAGSLLLACGERDPAEPARDALAQEEPVALPVLVSATARPPELARALELQDPGRDTWQTEVFYQGTSSVLHDLALWMERDPDAEEPLPGLADLVAPDFRASVLRPELMLVFESAGIRVMRPRGPLDPAPAPHSALQALEGLLAPFAAPREVHFKTVSVDTESAPPTTRLLVSVDGQGSGPNGPHRIQQRATWMASWGPPSSEGDDLLPRLLALELEAFEEVRGPARDGDAPAEPLFADVTGSVLGEAASFREQLAFPLAHWAARIDAGLGISYGGHEGLAVGDANGDGLDDLYVCQPGGLPNRLYLQQADGTARDASVEAGLDWLDPTPAALFLDLDRDGDQDLVVETDPHLLFLENDGSGRFELRFELETSSTTSLSAADYDADGDLDVYALGYMMPDSRERAPLPYHDANNGRPNHLLRNDVEPGRWLFTDVTRPAGLDRNNHRFSFASAWEDYDLDGDPDLYVANDFGRNNLYRNDGGRFTDVAGEAGVEDMAAGMAVTWLDYDLDGLPDLHVANMFSSAGGRITYQRRFKEGAGDELLGRYRHHARGNTLFRNLGGGRFQDVSVEAGITMGRWAWGAIEVELDNDGRPDLFVPNGFVTGEDPDDL